MFHKSSLCPEPQKPAPDLKLGRVLVVDDVALNREILIMHLGDTVRHIDEAAEGQAALTRFKLCRYDAVLLDIEMPGLDGYDTLKELRTWERERQLPLTPVVAITSSDFPEDEQRILAAGATAYLAKPVKQQELLAVLQLHCITEPSAHPMGNLLPRFFASAGDMLGEIADSADPADPENMLKQLHKLRGMVAVYGFPEFADRLKLVHLGVQRGEMPGETMLAQLREELRRLQAASSKPD